MVHSVFYKIIPLAIMGILIMSYASKAPPEGHTGSPTDGKSCAISGCHGTSSIAGSNMISHDIPSTGYEPGKEYNVSVVVSKSSSSVFGFQFSAQASDGSKVGTLTSGGAGTVVSNTGKYISHAGNQVNGSGGSKTWPFKWTAPAANTGTIHFYVSGNASNNNGMTSGDEIQVFSMEIKEKGVETGISQVAAHKGFKFYPNPTRGALNFTSSEAGVVKVVATSGRLVKQIEIFTGNSKADLSELDNGIYFISYSDGKNDLSNQTLIKY